ncbi:MAG: sortase B protein-sorting domain-containing protein [Thermodesulfobacteriota bacterium]|jgi:hypothetical protein
MRKKICSFLFLVLLSLTVYVNAWAQAQQIGSVPTITEWGMMILSVLLVGSALFFIRKRRRA